MKTINFVINHLHRLTVGSKAKELTDKQMLVVSISAITSITHPIIISDLKKNQVVGVLRDLGSQMIDMLHYFGGEVVEVKALWIMLCM